MYTITDNRKKDIMTFEKVKIGEFFYGQIFDCSIDQEEERLCLKTEEENYFCFSTNYNCLLYYCDYPVSVMEIFNNDNKNIIKISVE